MFSIRAITLWFRSNFPSNHSKWFSKANHPIEMNMIWKSMLIPSMGYVVGLILGFIVYRKPRVYEQRNVNDREKLLNSNLMCCYCHCHTSYVLVQTFTDSMIFVR